MGAYLFSKYLSNDEAIVDCEGFFPNNYLVRYWNLRKEFILIWGMREIQFQYNYLKTLYGTRRSKIRLVCWEYMEIEKSPRY